MDATRAAQVLVPVSRIECLTCLSCNTGQHQDKRLLEREGEREGAEKRRTKVRGNEEQSKKRRKKAVK